ncbi:hypothetical protein D8S78_17415 [Natrialba swarupiae]|nr:hypothetical protein [Natrialba swarupiae]
MSRYRTVADTGDICRRRCWLQSRQIRRKKRPPESSRRKDVRRSLGATTTVAGDGGLRLE